MNTLLFLRQFFRYWLCAVYKRSGFPHRTVVILLLMTPYITEAQLNQVDIYLDNKPILRVTYENNDSGGASAVPQQQVIISPHPDFVPQYQGFSSLDEYHKRVEAEKSFIYRVPCLGTLAEIAKNLEEQPYGFLTGLPIEHTERDINGLTHLAGQLHHLSQTMVFMPTSNTEVIQINSPIFLQSVYSDSDSLYVWIDSGDINFNTWHNFFQRFQFSQNFLAAHNPLTVFMMPPFSGMLTQASWFSYLEMDSFALCSDTLTTPAETHSGNVVTSVSWVNVNNVTYIMNGDQLQMHISSQSQASQPIEVHAGSRCITSYTREELHKYIRSYKTKPESGKEEPLSRIINPLSIIKEEGGGSKNSLNY